MGGTSGDPGWGSDPPGMTQTPHGKRINKSDKSINFYNINQ